MLAQKVALFHVVISRNTAAPITRGNPRRAHFGAVGGAKDVPSREQERKVPRLEDVTSTPASQDKTGVSWRPGYGYRDPGACQGMLLLKPITSAMQPERAGYWLSAPRGSVPDVEKGTIHHGLHGRESEIVWAVQCAVAR